MEGQVTLPMKYFHRYRWPLYWLFFICLIGLCLVLIFIPSLLHEKIHDLLVEALGAFIGVYLSLLIFMKSKEHSDEQNRLYLEAVHENARNQINAYMASTDRQIEEWARNTQRQIDAILEASHTQVTALKQTKGSTSYERAAHRRQLSYEISGLNEALREAHQELERRKEFVFLRKKEERRKEIADQDKIIEDLLQKLENCQNDLDALDQD